ncbi:MAG: TraR/DksA family transcriptional regulator [Saprospiraceae bacterium]
MEEKTRYSDDELKEFEAIIDQKLAKAEEELNYYLNQIKELAENDGTKVKGLDDGQGTIESTRLQQMASRQTKLIQHLNNAKMRISNKVYGICSETGKLISKARLKAVPHATLSIEAKQKQAPRV